MPITSKLSNGCDAGLGWEEESQLQLLAVGNIDNNKEQRLARCQFA